MYYVRELKEINPIQDPTCNLRLCCTCMLCSADQLLYLFWYLIYYYLVSWRVPFFGKRRLKAVFRLKSTLWDSYWLTRNSFGKNIQSRKMNWLTSNDEKNLKIFSEQSCRYNILGLYSPRSRQPLLSHRWYMHTPYDRSDAIFLTHSRFCLPI